MNSLLPKSAAQRCTFGADDRFGPAVPTHCRESDFTLYFEQSFFSLTPSLIFILFSSIYLPSVFRRTTKACGDRIHGIKLVL